MHCIKESSLLVTLLIVFDAPRSDSAPGELWLPCTPLVTTLVSSNDVTFTWEYK